MTDIERQILENQIIMMKLLNILQCTTSPYKSAYDDTVRKKIDKTLNLLEQK